MSLLLAAGAGLPLSASVPDANWPLYGYWAQGDPPTPHLAFAEHLAVLRDGNADRVARDAAADALVRLAHRPQVSQTLADVLTDDQQQEVRGPLLRAIARTWNPPARLFQPLVDLASRSDAQRASAAMAAIGAYGTREAVHALIGFLRADRPAAVRDAAAAALARMTGRDDLRSDVEAWSQWLSAARGLNDLEWRDLLAEGVWRRADRLEADRRSIAERLSEGYRRLYLATPAEDRARLLSQMMLDPRAELRDAGLEIVTRELAAGKSMDGAVAEAAARLLRSPDARVRTRAASLVAQLGPSTATPAIIEALDAERDLDAAAAMLQAIARAPEAAAAASVLRWLEKPETRVQAIDAALALHRSGYLLEPSDHDAVLTALRETDASQLTVSGVRLLAVIGDESDRERLAILLEVGTGAARSAAAEALAEFPDYVDHILEAARRDPALFAFAVRAVAAYRNSVHGLMAINELIAPATQEHRAGLLRVAAALPMVDLLTVASSTTTDLVLREALLARVVERPMGPFFPGEEEDLGTLGECILLLAETRLALKRPDRALAAVEALPNAWTGAHTPRTARLRLIALLWTNRLAAAAEVDAPIEAWLDALELAIAEAHAPAILSQIRARWSEQMSPEVRERLTVLEASLPPAPANGQAEPDRDDPGGP